MPVNIHPAMLVLVLAWTGIATGMLYYFWRKSGNLYALLVEGANRYEELREANRSLETSMANADQRVAGHREESRRLQDELIVERKRAKTDRDTLAAKELELKTVREKYEGQKRHLQDQLAKAQQAVEALSSERNQAQENLKTQKETLHSQVDLMKNRYEQKLESVSKDLKTKSSELEELQKKFRAVDPAAVIKTKRRIHQYERMYQSMRGLREMADERNHNWEVALQKLSNWILKESGCVKTRGTLPREIGPLVGQALQAIGEQLIDDGEQQVASPPNRDAAKMSESLET